MYVLLHTGRQNNEILTKHRKSSRKISLKAEVHWLAVVLEVDLELEDLCYFVFAAL